MALIIRIDVDRPYGKQPFFRHVLSRMASDLYFPRTQTLGYLEELGIILHALNERNARAYVFFRRCTLPSPGILKLIAQGRHEIGLHLEDSRSYQTFSEEKSILERHIGRPVRAISKHGSGGAKYGLHHHAPYEPDKYVEWARKDGMKVFLGNLEDPSIRPACDGSGLHVFPSAFWLEPAWRDTKTFSVDWLLSQARLSDVVLLIHPENILADWALYGEFVRLAVSLDTRILE